MTSKEITSTPGGYKMKLFLEKILEGYTLTSQESYMAMDMLCSPQNNDIQAAAFLAVLQNRGEKIEEILGFITYLREHSLIIDVADFPVIDVCGTGGDYRGTFNISTATALLLASAGVKVAKHGGRSVSGKCGSMDVAEELGFALCQQSTEVVEQLQRQNIAFLSAANFYPIFKKISALRKTLGIRTCFNVLGVLLNPVSLKRQVIGVYNKELLMPLASILLRLGYEQAMIVHARDGLDEISICAETDVAYLQAGKITQFSLVPEEFGLKRAKLAQIQGGDKEHNATIIRRIFQGEQSAKRDVVLLNAAAGFLVSGKVSSFLEGIKLAKQTIDSGTSYQFLMRVESYAK